MTLGKVSDLRGLFELCFDRFYGDYFRPKIATDVIFGSTVTVEDVGLDINE